MRVATGVDIVDLAEISSTLEDPSQLQRMLYPGDSTGNARHHVAGRIALKEATIKALGLAAGSWLNIHIHTSPTGKPVLSIATPVTGLISLDGSISHHGKTVIGFVVALFDDENN
jgi:phosphopantetheine--protein transferase-like protein